MKGEDVDHLNGQKVKSKGVISSEEINLQLAYYHTGIIRYSTIRICSKRRTR